MARYLYGASVQGIQGFIFQTNKLAEIVGGSELVESICTTFFRDKCPNFNEQSLLMGAAGNIKYIFNSDEDCKKFILNFPKEVMSLAPGISLSQAVVQINTEYPSHENIDSLENKLKGQRNKASMPIETGFMALERARRTGGVVFGNDENMNKDKNDEATLLKLKSSKNAKTLFNKISGLSKDQIDFKSLAYDISDITKSGKNTWIAVIHADGNGLGNILQNYGRIITENKEFKIFSDLIQKSTEKACQTAFKKIDKGEKYKYPIRPVVIGGDDVTIIIRADLALEFAVEFLKSFENETEANFKVLKTKELHSGLTACVGIAYVKESYPLHYALKLAEDLCKDAKKMVKNAVPKRQDNMPKSSLAIFRVQDSFVENLEDMKERTLKTGNGIDFDYGPYLIQKEGNYPNVDDLNKKLEVLKKEAESKEKSKAVSKLRQLISASYNDESTIKIMKDRMKSVNSEFYHQLDLDKELKQKTDDSQGKSMLYDLIQLHSFKY